MGCGGWEELFCADGGDKGDDFDAEGAGEVELGYCAGDYSADCFAGGAVGGLVLVVGDGWEVEGGGDGESVPAAAATAGADTVFHLISEVGVGGSTHCEWVSAKLLAWLQLSDFLCLFTGLNMHEPWECVHRVAAIVMRSLIFIPHEH